MKPRALVAAALALAVQAACAQPVPATGDPAPRNTRHALVIGIGEYSKPEIPTLAGVAHDMASARQMARAMAIPDSHIVVIRDHEATAARIRREIAQLTARIAPGDRVFVYYSGHGTRWYDAATRSDGCTEGLLATDAQVITNVEMARLLKELAAKTDKLLVFYDACFSGGVASAPFRTRSFSLPGERLTPKFAAGVSQAACTTPSNFRTRSLALVLQQGGSMPENVVHVAASRPDEVSFDSSARGGFATVAWRDCLLGQAADLDRSGGVTVDEVTRCAQGKVSALLLNAPGISGQHLTIGGNPSFVPAWMGAAFAPDAVAPAGSAPNAPAAAPAPAERMVTAHEILGEIHRQRHGGRSVDVQLKSSTLRIERDALELVVTSLHSGYVYLALAGSDGKSLYLLYPNSLDADNRIKAGQALKLPRARWEVVAGGPVGRDTLLVMVTDAPRDLGGLAGESSGPFMKTLLDERGRARLQWIFANGTPSADCIGAAQPGSPACSDAFGSALVAIEEVQ
jgi:hypothetical protein